MNRIQSVHRFWRSGLVIAALLAVCAPAQAQQKPSAAALATGKEIVTIKGATAMFSRIIPNVIEQTKGFFMQQNPALGKELNEVGEVLRVEFASRQDEVTAEVARLYASRFTEQELKDVLTFYKTPLGQKIIAQEPQIVDEGVKFAQDWARFLSDEVMARMRAEMRKRGHAL